MTQIFLTVEVQLEKIMRRMTHKKYAEVLQKIKV